MVLPAARGFGVYGHSVNTAPPHPDSYGRVWEKKSLRVLCAYYAISSFGHYTCQDAGERGRPEECSIGV